MKQQIEAFFLLAFPLVVLASLGSPRNFFRLGPRGANVFIVMNALAIMSPALLAEAFPRYGIWFLVGGVAWLVMSSVTLLATPRLYAVVEFLKPKDLNQQKDSEHPVDENASSPDV